MNTNERKLSEKTWFIILMFFIFWPVSVFFFFKNQYYSRTIKIVVPIIILFFGMFSVTISSMQSTNNVENQTLSIEEQIEKTKEVDSTPEKTKNNTFGVDIQTFKSNFNTLMLNLGSGLSIGNGQISEGVKDVFNYYFSENISTIITINKESKEVEEMSILASPEDTQTALDFMVLMGGVIAITNPELSADERGDILNQLRLTEEGVDVGSLNETVIINGVDYSLIGIKDAGIITFTASK